MAARPGIMANTSFAYWTKYTFPKFLEQILILGRWQEIYIGCLTYVFFSSLKKSLEILRNKCLKKMDPWNWSSLGLQRWERRSHLMEKVLCKRSNGCMQGSLSLTVQSILSKSLDFFSLVVWTAKLNVSLCFPKGKVCELTRVMNRKL